MDIAALVLGIIALVLSFIPVVGSFALVLGSIGLLLGIIALILKWKNGPRAMATVSIFLSGFSIFMGLANIVLIVATSK